VFALEFDLVLDLALNIVRDLVKLVLDLLLNLMPERDCSRIRIGTALSRGVQSGIKPREDGCGAAGVLP
jgi:hypothetical protein